MFEIVVNGNMGEVNLILKGVSIEDYNTLPTLKSELLDMCADGVNSNELSNGDTVVVKPEIVKDHKIAKRIFGNGCVYCNIKNSIEVRHNKRRYARCTSCKKEHYF